MMKETDRDEKSTQGLFMEMTHSYFVKLYNQLMKSGLHPGQIPLIKLLGKESGLSQKQLADRLHIKPPTVAVSIKRLEKSGFLIRKQDELDQRITRIYLTEEGLGLSNEIRTIMARNEEELFLGFSEGEVCLIRRYFELMNENIKKTTAKEVPPQAFDQLYHGHN